MSGIVGKEPFGKSGVIGAFTSFGIDDNADATAITIDSSENVTFEKNVTVGDGSSGETLLVVKGGEANNAEIDLFADQADDDADKWKIVADTSGNLGISTKSSGSYVEIMKLDAVGLGVGISANPHTLNVSKATDDGQVVKFNNSHASPRVMILTMSGASPDDTTQTFVEGNDSSGAEFRIRSDGSYYQNSDRRTKENIVDADAMLDKVNDFRVVNYNRIGDKNKNLHLGVISQEVEEIFPHLVFTEDAVEAIEEVRDENDKVITSAIQSQEERKTLYKIGLIFPLIKAVQELSAKVTALESA